MTFVGVYSLILLTKILLVPSTDFYGFAHGMPAYLLFVAVLFSVPSMLIQRFQLASTSVFLSSLIIGMIVIEISATLRLDQRLIATKTLAFGNPPDRMFVTPTTINLALHAFFEKAPTLIPPGSTLTVVPEGVMLNYLLRQPLGTPYLNFMVTEYCIFGKENIEGSFATHRPDFILLTHKYTSEFGYPLFGKMPEYGADVMTWLKREYGQIALFGEQPLTSKDSEGVALWRRKDFLETSSRN